LLMSVHVCPHDTTYSPSHASATSRAATVSGSGAFARELALHPTRPTTFDYGCVFQNSAAPERPPSSPSMGDYVSRRNAPAQQNQSLRRAQEVGSSPYQPVQGPVAHRDSVNMPGDTRTRMLDNMAALEALNPERAKTYLQTAPLGPAAKLDMMNRMHLSSTGGQQLHGDIIGMSRIQATEQRQGSVGSTLQHTEMWSKVVSDIQGSGFSTQQQADFLRRVPTTTRAKADLIRSTGNHAEADYYAGREATTQFGRGNSYGAAPMSALGARSTTTCSNTYLPKRSSASPNPLLY